jgi:hypothetical protein
MHPNTSQYNPSLHYDDVSIYVVQSMWNQRVHNIRRSMWFKPLWNQKINNIANSANSRTRVKISAGKIMNKPTGESPDEAIYDPRGQSI